MSLWIFKEGLNCFKICGVNLLVLKKKEKISDFPVYKYNKNLRKEYEEMFFL